MYGFVKTMEFLYFGWMLWFAFNDIFDLFFNTLRPADNYNLSGISLMTR